MSSDLQGLVWLVVLLASNAFFVGAEFALISARRAQIEPRAEAGSRPAKITLSAMENVSLMLATAQLGITISSLLILLIAEPSIHHLLEYPLHALGVPDAVLSSVTFAITLLIAIGLIATTIGTFKAQPWTRGAILTWQIMQFVVATSFIQGIEVWQPVGWILATIAVGTTLLLFSKPVTMTMTAEK